MPMPEPPLASVPQSQTHATIAQQQIQRHNDHSSSDSSDNDNVRLAIDWQSAPPSTRATAHNNKDEMSDDGSSNSDGENSVAVLPSSCCLYMHDVTCTKAAHACMHAQNHSAMHAIAIN
jgi:hypothetical protein